ncbi:hypothetical protein N476_20820 [Pseudoalteromonas luteoviolacea H33]|uniref:Uncharacterized protein n=1 Tax=Pseudoalteromonas luteoviolacea H33 TaxID=1365251 RepID=A0A167DGI6_9GAMM|nr:hypothetical protein N476_20820 [Pseudoalteromonas luteoviolacea H33]KZN72871.1 hypothetical protein N477_24245 [Pseudoalteromonas luteoviolacea H33-S]
MCVNTANYNLPSAFSWAENSKKPQQCGFLVKKTGQ